MAYQLGYVYLGLPKACAKLVNDLIIHSYEGNPMNLLYTL